MKSSLTSLPLKSKSVTKFKFLLCTYMPNSHVHILTSQSTQRFLPISHYPSNPFKIPYSQPQTSDYTLSRLSSSPDHTPLNAVSHSLTYHVMYTHKAALITPVASLAMFYPHAFNQVMWLRPGLPWGFKHKDWATETGTFSGQPGSMVQLNIQPNTDRAVLWLRQAGSPGKA